MVQAAKTEKGTKKREKREKKKRVSVNNGQAMHGAHKPKRKDPVLGLWNIRGVILTFKTKFSDQLQADQNENIFIQYNVTNLLILLSVERFCCC